MKRLTPCFLLPLSPFLFLLCFSTVSGQEILLEDDHLYEEMMNDAEFQKFLRMTGQAFPFEEKAVPVFRGNSEALSLYLQLRRHQMEENERNRDTIGYKRWEYDFHFPRQPMMPGETPPLRLLSVGLKIDMRQGELRQTDENLDLAIEGSGFFRIIDRETAQILYTRCGSFERDTEGFLALIQGERVFRLAPEISVPEEFDSLRISEDGQVTGDDKVLGRLELILFPNPRRLRPVDDRCFAETPLSGKPKTKGNTGKIQQGFLEESNAGPGINHYGSNR